MGDTQTFVEWIKGKKKFLKNHTASSYSFYNSEFPEFNE